MERLEVYTNMLECLAKTCLVEGEIVSLHATSLGSWHFNSRNRSGVRRLFPTTTSFARQAVPQVLVEEASSGCATRMCTIAHPLLEL